IYYSLKDNFWSYIREPSLFGIPSFIPGICHLLLIGFLGYGIFLLANKIRRAWQKRQIFRNFTTNISLTSFYLISVFFGYGLIITFSGTTIFPHYLICAFPIQYIS